MLTLRRNGRSISELGWKWGETNYQLRSWYIPILYASIAYAIVWILRLGAFGNPEFYDSLAKSMHLGGPPWISFVLGIVLIGTFGMVRSVSSALGEEIGWRGFLVPDLSKSTSFTTTSLISGVVWSLWHYPILIFADYTPARPLGTASLASPCWSSPSVSFLPGCASNPAAFGPAPSSTPATISISRAFSLP